MTLGSGQRGSLSGRSWRRKVARRDCRGSRGLGFSWAIGCRQVSEPE